MKISIVLLATASLLASELLLGVLAADKPTGDLQLRGSGGGTGGRGEQDERNLQEHLGFDPSKIKVIVKVKSEKGSVSAKTRASKVSYESKRFKIVAMEINAKDMLALENDPEIESVDLDQEMHIFPPIKDEDLPSVSAGKPKKLLPPSKPLPQKHHRRLAESQPYGIQKVQADQVAPGPDANQIKICVVDTGCKYDCGITECEYTTHCCLTFSSYSLALCHRRSRSS